MKLSKYRWGSVFETQTAKSLLLLWNPRSWLYAT